MTGEEVENSIKLIGRLLEYLSKGSHKLEDLTKSEAGTTVTYYEGKFLIVWIEKSSSGIPISWKIAYYFSPRILCSSGMMEIISLGLTNVQEYIMYATHSLYKKEFRKAREAGDKEKWDRLMKEWEEKQDEIQRDFTERRNLDRYMANEHLKNLVLHIKYADEIARMVGEKHGVEVIHHVCPPPEEYDFFRAVFNAKDMSEDQIFEEARKRIDAVREAYDPFSPPYHPSPRNLNKIRQRLQGSRKKHRM